MKEVCSHAEVFLEENVVVRIQCIVFAFNLSLLSRDGRQFAVAHPLHLSRDRLAETQVFGDGVFGGHVHGNGALLLVVRYLLSQKVGSLLDGESNLNQFEESFEHGEPEDHNFKLVLVGDAFVDFSGRVGSLVKTHAHLLEHVLVEVLGRSLLEEQFEVGQI